MVQATSSTIVSEPAATTPQPSRTMLPMRILRGVQFLFAVIVIGTIGAVINSDNNIDGCHSYGSYNYACFFTPASFKYNIFAGVWTWLVVAYALVSTTCVPAIYHVIPALFFDALSIIIWFAAWVSVAVWIGADSYFYDRVGTNKGLSLLQAGTVFGAFIWLTFIATFVLSIVSYLRSRRAAAAAAPVTSQPMQEYPQPQTEAQAVHA